MKMGFCVESIGKDVYFEHPFVEIVERMGWKLTDNGTNWLVSFPSDDEEIFDFVFGV